MSAKLTKLGIAQRRWSFLHDPASYQEAYESQVRDAPLRGEATRRQLATAGEILRRLGAQKGVMLADDVGLGKTSVAALVACVFAGTGKKVRILAPNPTMKRRWCQELARQLPVLASLMRAAPARQRCLDPDLLERAHERSKSESVWNVMEGDIQVTTHLRGAKRSMWCDLLIVDEAHRARSSNSFFGRALVRKKKHYARVLLVTATPFSLSVSELASALRLLGAPDADIAATRQFGKALEKLWCGDFSQPEEFGKALATKGTQAAKALKPWVIRHSVTNLLRERDEFGGHERWNIDVQPVSATALEVIVRADRWLRLARDAGLRKGKRTNDPRFHQGWRQLETELRKLRDSKALAGDGLDRAAIRAHVDWIARQIEDVGVHEKVKAVAAAIQHVTTKSEKALAFCDHHAPAQELTLALANTLRPASSGVRLARNAWLTAWRKCLDERLEEERAKGPPGSGDRYEQFLRWLSCGAIRAQVGAWLRPAPRSSQSLVDQLSSTKPRRTVNGLSIADEAARLFRVLNDAESASTRAMLDAGARALPGWGRRLVPVMSSANPPKDGARIAIFHAKQPDTMLAIFNSPFGPDVLVATDRLSEGVDLHKWCRHLVHYELDPSPIRAVQRRGRLRRIDSWASRSRQPICEAFPRLRGTRDGQLVSIVSQRLEQFELLLGGISAPVDQDAPETTAARQQLALATAKRHMKPARLCVV